MRPRADPAAAVERDRIEHHHMPLALGRPAAIDDAEGAPGQGLRQLPGIADGRRAAHEARCRAVVGADAQQAAQDVGDMAAEDAAVGVRLIDDDVANLLEELEPLGVVGQDGRAQHVRIGDDYLACLAHDGPDGGRRVTVVDGRREVHAGQPGQVPELSELVLAERLGGEEVQRPRRGILRDGLQDGQVVAERFARCGGRHDGHILPGSQRLECLRLMAVQRADASSLQGAHETRLQPVRDGHVLGRLGWQDVPRREAGPHVGLRQQAVQGIQRGTRLMQSHGRPHKSHIRSVRASLPACTRA